jgi:alcohol dehydrogenase
MLASLDAAGVATYVFDQVQPDIPRDTVLGACALAAGLEPDLVIGIGGGSCLDMAKCASLILAHGGRVEDYYGEFKVPGPILPVIALPTTAGTGSEVTPVAVLSDPDRVMKIGISSPFLIPQAAICDPELTLTCPPKLTAIAGADALTHAIEAFTTARREPDADLALQHVFVGKSALTDHFALLAVRLLARSLRRAVEDGTDLDARADVMMGAMAAGCAFGAAARLPPMPSNIPSARSPIRPMGSASPPCCPMSWPITGRPASPISPSSLAPWGWTIASSNQWQSSLPPSAFRQIWPSWACLPTVRPGPPSRPSASSG